MAFAPQFQRLFTTSYQLSHRNSRSFQNLTKHFSSKSLLSDNTNKNDRDEVMMQFYRHQYQQTKMPWSTVGNYCTSPNLPIISYRYFHTEAEFHNIADETLETIQDALDDMFDEDFENDENLPEINLASGVLTIKLGSHGTWVINKQTPNRQLWWSSPISGPRRYEYDETNEVWVYTRAIDAEKESKPEDNHEKDTLGIILNREIMELYNVDLGLNV